MRQLISGLSGSLSKSLFLFMALLFFIVSCDSDDSGPSPDDQNVEEEKQDNEENQDNEEESNVLTAEDFENIDPDSPSFVSIDNTTPQGMKWVKVEELSDDFDTWDNTKWYKLLWNYDVPVQMRAENSGVSDGVLWIKATLDDGAERWFETSRISSKAKISYPMYTEASIKTAHISAYNTYWMNDGDINERDEIDIIENNSKPSCNCQPEMPGRMNAQYFHVDPDLTPKEVREHAYFNRSDLSDANPLKNKGWNEDYHTYGVWWKDSQHIQFYLDGEPAGSVVVGEDRSGTFYPNREFTRDLSIIFDLWTNEADWLGGLSDKQDLLDESINTMKVNWVRTWKLEPKE